MKKTYTLNNHDHCTLQLCVLEDLLGKKVGHGIANLDELVGENYSAGFL